MRMITALITVGIPYSEALEMPYTRADQIISAHNWLNRPHNPGDGKGQTVAKVKRRDNGAKR